MKHLERFCLALAVALLVAALAIPPSLVSVLAIAALAIANIATAAWMISKERKS